MVELKVYVDGIQRVVCGVSEDTSCQDVIIALAQATGQTGKFKLVERNQGEKRTLKPQEKPLHVMSKWNKSASDAFFTLVTVGDTPNTSRPPSSMGYSTIDRFRQPGDGSDLSEFPKQRQASIRRSMTFNGLYQGGGATKVKDLKEKVNQKAEKLHTELTELIDMQKRRLADQEVQLNGMDSEIEGLRHLESINDSSEKSDRTMEEMQRTLETNKSAIEDVEIWEHEFDIEQQLQKELLQEISAMRDQLTHCEENIKLKQKEAEQILDQIEREKARQKRVAEEQLQRHLDDVNGEVKLLEDEYRGYSANLEETNQFLVEVTAVLDQKKEKEKKLLEEIEGLLCDVSKNEPRVPLAVIDIDSDLSSEMTAPSPTLEPNPATQQPQEAIDQGECKYLFVLCSGIARGCGAWGKV